tara:strand:+ start:57 stop:257 length:201 start_codon:yes stop_codon:yes gene_type:complete
MKLSALFFIIAFGYNQAFGTTFMSTITKSFGKTSGCSSDQSASSSGNQKKENNLTFKGSKKDKNYR